jgi:hypothetical protein
MSGERTVPLLPCASIEEMADFHGCLGFETTYRQQKPNPYLALRRDDLHLHYFALPDFRAEDSYGSCLVLVPDPGPLFEAFATGLRSRYGTLPLRGFPRITRPRRRKNADGHTGFSLVDPSGNWIRVFRDGADELPDDAGEESRLARGLADAVVLADSKGDVAQAAKVLAGALRRTAGEPASAERAEALAYLVELSVGLDDAAAAGAALDELDRLLLPADRDSVAARQQALELRQALQRQGRTA